MDAIAHLPRNLSRWSIMIGLTIALTCCRSSDTAVEHDNTIRDSTKTASNASEQPQDSLMATDSFLLQILGVRDSMERWGFSTIREDTYSQDDEYKRHWWLKNFQRPNSRYQELYPDSTDMQRIVAIRQFEFTKNWKMVVEEWTFQDNADARHWLQIAFDTERMDNQKPPRIFWQEDNKIYFIMATAAIDWFEHGHALIRIFSGKSRLLIDLLNRPLDLVHYKKLKMANSGLAEVRSYYHKPDTTGVYYRYFGFRIKPYREPEIWKGLTVVTFKYNGFVGDYHDTNEELISITGKLPDRDLGIINLVGVKRHVLEEDYGLSYFDEEKLMMANLNGNLLIVHLQDDIVEWFHYVKTNLHHAKTPSDLPAELKTYNP